MCVWFQDEGPEEAEEPETQDHIRPPSSSSQNKEWHVVISDIKHNHKYLPP